MSDEQFMSRAIALAKLAYACDEVPVGAVIVQNNTIIGEGFNQSITLHDPSAHAEIIAIRNAAQTLQNYRLVNATLYVTLEPCVMCIGAMIHARIQRLVFAAKDPKTGAVCSVDNLIDKDYFNHKIQWDQGLYTEESAELLKSFFKTRRVQKKEKCPELEGQ